jgi:hypothetical protein
MLNADDYYRNLMGLNNRLIDFNNLDKAVRFTLKVYPDIREASEWLLKNKPHRFNKLQLPFGFVYTVQQAYKALGN